MRKIVPVIVLISLLVVSCGSTRFAFDRTERSIIELGGKYDKKVEEDIKKFYEKEDLDELIKEVYKGTYTTVDVQGYLGDDIYKEYEKRDEEILKEIETMRMEEGLEEVANAVLDETYPEAQVIAALGGEEKKLASDFKEVLDEKMGIKNDLRGILEEEGYDGIKNALLAGDYDEETVEEYLGKSTLDRVKEIYAKETGIDGFNPAKSGEKAVRGVKFTSAGKNNTVNSVEDEDEKEQKNLIVEVALILVVIVVVYVAAAVVRSLNREPLGAGISALAAVLMTAVSVGVAFLIGGGWSVYYLAFLLILPVYFVLTADFRG